jgi:WD40 repeat protein
MMIVGTALAQGPSAPRISTTSPPPEDIRKPDITITGSDVTGTGVIAYNPNGRFLAVSAGEKTIRIYDARPGDRLKAELLKTLTGHAAQILGLCFCDTNTLVSISLDQTAKIWDVESGKLLHSTDLPLGKQVRFAIAPGQQSLAADSSFGKARLWNYRTGELLKTFEPNDSWVSALAFTPDGKLLVIGTDKGVVRVMDVATWKVTRTIDLDSPVHSLAASAEHIAVGYGDGTVAMLNLGEQSSVPEVRKQTGAINGLAFSPKGDQFASASADRTVKVWDAATLKLRSSLEGHVAGVVDVTFSPNGQKMASIDADGNVNYWSVPPPPIPPGNLEEGHTPKSR